MAYRVASRPVLCMVLLLFVAMAAPLLAQAAVSTPPPAPSLKAVIVGDGGTLLFGQLRPWPAPTEPTASTLWRGWLGPVQSGTILDLLGAGWQPNGAASLVSGGEDAQGVLGALTYPDLKVVGGLPEALQGGLLRGIDWSSELSPLTIWPPLFVDRALIAGAQVEGCGRVLLFSPPDRLVALSAPELEGVDLWDVAWLPSGTGALAVGAAGDQGLALLLELSSPPSTTLKVTEFYRGEGGPLRAVAVSPSGTLALAVGGRVEVGPAQLARVLRFELPSLAATDLSEKAQATGLEFHDVVFAPMPAVIPAIYPPPSPIAVLGGGNTGANVLAALAYTPQGEGGTFSPAFVRSGPAINGLAFDRSGRLLVAVCDRPAAGGNAPVVLASAAGVAAFDSGTPANLQAVSVRQVGELVAWPLVPLPAITLPRPPTDAYLETVSLGAKSSLVEGSLVYGLSAVVAPLPATTASAPACQVTVWVVVDSNGNGVRDIGEPEVARAAGPCGERLRLPFAEPLPLPAGAQGALVLGVELPTDAASALPGGARMAVTEVMALGMESQRILFVRGLPVQSPPLLPRLVTKFAAWPNPFSPNGDGMKDRTDLVRVLSRPALCTIKLFRGAEVRTLISRAPTPAGRSATPWDGRDAAGNLVPDGAYLAKLWAVDEYGVLEAATTTVVVDTTRPVVSNLWAVPPVFSPNGDGVDDTTRLTCTLSEPCCVTVQVYQGTTRLAQLSWAQVPAGTYSVTWDGRAGGSVVPNGTYRVGIFPRDLAGNPGLPGWLSVTVANP